jgi:hypothetical protein
MKKSKAFMATLVMCFTIITSFAQTTTQIDTVYVTKETDAMSGKIFIYPSRAFVVANDENKKGFRISGFIRDNLTLASIHVTMVGLGRCNEDDEIIILFENGQKITAKSWKKFNCEGDAYFNINDKDSEILRTQKLSKIRMTNGRTFDSYTGDVKAKDVKYFMQLLHCLDNKLVIDKK